MNDREVIELLASILSGRVVTDPILKEIDRETSSSSINARRTTGRRRGVRGSEQRDAKLKRKVSGYQKEFGRQYKKLKKAHPRTSPKMLMKKAHRLTKKVRK